MVIVYLGVSEIPDEDGEVWNPMFGTVHTLLVPITLNSDSETHICHSWSIPRLKDVKWAYCLTPLRRIRLLKRFLSCGCFIEMNWQVQEHYPKVVYSLSDISCPVVRQRLASEIQVELYWAGSTGRLRSQAKANTWYDEDVSMGGSNVWPESGEDMKEYRSAMLEY